MSRNAATPLVARRPLATDPGHIRVKNQRISPWGILYTLGNVTYKNKKSTKNDSGKSCPRYKENLNSFFRELRFFLFGSQYSPDSEALN